MRTKSGEVAHDICVTCGTFVTLPVATVNCLEVLWGADAKQFRAGRWLETDITPQAQELQGYHYLVTIWDGPKTCLGGCF
ncbi:hypothetical protein SCLCIDRAFT_1159436, partial [Scleroderma citrinum Foug A]